MRIEQVDFFYVSMPVVEDKADGSQDSLLVRVQGDGFTGWGECEASPLVSIAAFVAPMSHSACKPVRASILGERVESIADIRRLAQKVAHNGFDMLQTPHTFSGIEIALCDALAREKRMPVYKLLGYENPYPKLAYASMLFAPTPAETAISARSAADQGFRAIKFGWAGFGKNYDFDHATIEQTRIAVGPDIRLMVDVGTIWSTQPEEAFKRVKMLEEFGVTWIEEPFENYQYNLYADLEKKCTTLKVAAGEGSHSLAMATNMIDHGHVQFIQIDTGRIGGIVPAYDVAQYALKKGIQFVNHTFTTSLALSASLQPMIGIKQFEISEYPFQPSPLARDINTPWINPDKSGMIQLPEGDGLAVGVDLDVLAKYLVPVKIESHGKVIYETPKVGSKEADRKVTNAVAPNGAPATVLSASR